MSHNIELEVNCPSCNGTGLYRGLAEHDNCAVICSRCKGSGMTIVHYTKFTGRMLRTDIERVFSGAYGYGHSHKDVTIESGRTLHFSLYGCTYKKWLEGAKPLPMEELYCPYQYDNQGIGDEPFEECKHTGWGSIISECPFFIQKHVCWGKWNKGEAYKYKEVKQ